MPRLLLVFIASFLSLTTASFVSPGAYPIAPSTKHSADRDRLNMPCRACPRLWINEEACSEEIGKVAFCHRIECQSMHRTITFTQNFF